MFEKNKWYNSVLVAYWLFEQPVFDWLSYVAPGDQLSWVELATAEIPRLYYLAYWFRNYST